MRNIGFIVLLIMIALASCRTSSKSNGARTKVDEQLNIEQPADNENRIAFLTFEVTLTDSLTNAYTFRLKNKMFTNGKLKTALFNEAATIEPGFIYYQFTTSAQASEKDFEKIADPLAMVYEYPGENNALNKIVIKKKTAELLIRFQVDKNMKYINFYKPQTNSLTLKRIYHATL